MDHAVRRVIGLGVVAIALSLFTASGSASAQVAADPANVVARYSAALSAQDRAAALAMFDQQRGSATDGQGHTFSGPDGLTSFLLGNGFGTPGTRITTRRLTVVANRAIWIYACTCATQDTTVHMVLTVEGKISVFAVIPPAAQPAATRTAGELAPWLLVVALLLIGGGAWLLGARRNRGPVASPRPMQGQLLLALAERFEQRTAVCEPQRQ